MTIVVNGEPRALPDRTAVATVVASLTPDPAGVAVAVNGAVVPRGRWAATRLHDGDALEVLVAVQGG